MNSMSRMLEIIKEESGMRGVQVEVKKKAGDAYIPIEERDIKMADFHIRMKETLEAIAAKPIEEKAAFALAMRDAGNERFRADDYESALEMYAQSICGLDGAQMNGKKEIALPILTNMAFCFLQLNKANQALVLCDEALILDPTSAKAHFRRGKALAMLDRYNEAKLALDQARRHAPQDNTPATKELHKLAATTKRVKQIKAQQRTNFSNALSQGSVYQDKPIRQRRSKQANNPPSLFNLLLHHIPLFLLRNRLQLIGLGAWLLAALTVLFAFSPSLSFFQ